MLPVVVGHLAERRIPANLMKRIPAALFIGLGIWIWWTL